MHAWRRKKTIFDSTGEAHVRDTSCTVSRSILVSLYGGTSHLLAWNERLKSQAARLAEIEANRKPVYEDKPIIARGWESETAEETAREVRDYGAVGETVDCQAPLVMGTKLRRQGGGTKAETICAEKWVSNRGQATSCDSCHERLEWIARESEQSRQGEKSRLCCAAIDLFSWFSKEKSISMCTFTSTTL